MNRVKNIVALALAIVWLTGNALAKPCTDQVVEKVGSYNQASSINIFGPIKRVEFKRDHTLVVLQGYDEEACGILPTRAELERRRINLSWLQPGESFGISGKPHKAEDRRIWVVGIRHDPNIDPEEVR